LFRLQHKTRQLEMFPRPDKQMIGGIAIRPGLVSDVAFISWNAPNMPWDKSCVILRKSGIEKVYDNPFGDNIMQLAWRNQRELVMVGEVAGWWNLMSLDVELGTFEVLAKRPRECLVPLWQRGQNTLCVDPDRAVFVEQHMPGYCRLMVYDFAEKRLKQLNCPYTQIAQLAMANNGDLAIAGSSLTHKPGVALYTKAGKFVLPPATEVRPLFTLRKIGDEVCGWLYAVDQAGSIVIDCHGGPTGQHMPTYDEKISFWASQGVSYCALDYRGSTGRGKAFREAIYVHGEM